MAEFAQTAINKINQFYQQWVPKLPAEVNPRNVLIFVYWLCCASVRSWWPRHPCLMRNGCMKMLSTM